MGAFAQSGIVTGVVLATVVLTVGFLLLRWNRYFRKQPKNQPAIVQVPRPKPRGRTHGLDVPKEFAQWEVEMHEVARDLSAQLDSKMSALGSLIREADRASDRLEAILAAGARRAGYKLPPDMSIAGPSGSADVSESSVSKSSVPKSSGGGGPFSAFRKKKEEAPPEQELPIELRYQQICTLSDQGFDADQIAHQVGIPVGEIMLILGLRGGR